MVLLPEDASHVEKLKRWGCLVRRLTYAQLVSITVLCGNRDLNSSDKLLTITGLEHGGFGV